MFYVLCFMFYVLCFMFYVLCFILYFIFYILYFIFIFLNDEGRARSGTNRIQGLRDDGLIWSVLTPSSLLLPSFSLSFPRSISLSPLILALISLAGVWRHLDEMRGHTTLRQKVDLLTRFAKDHYPKQLPFFEKRFAAMAQHAEENNL